MTTSPPPKARQAPDARDPRLVGWRALLAAHTLVIDRLDQELRDETGLSLYEYSALLQLAEAPERRRRMSQLAEGILLTRSGVTRLIDRLERDGLVERCQCPSDGRGAEAALTETGLERLRGASRVHLRGVERYYLDRVSAADQSTIARVMGELIEGVREGG